MSYPRNPTESHPLRLASVAAIVALVGFAVLALPGTDPALASDTDTRWQTISESSYCGAPYTRAPYATRSGSLSDSQQVLGPFGTYFGRSISEVRSRLVYWTVPYSGGRRVRVHQAMLPSLQRVAANLNAQAAQGHVYNVKSVGAFVSRTIGGRYQISRHALGLAIDINPAQNPYRGDAKLITNMPDWFVEAWTSEGFCWGGDWKGAKDPMHFSWMGPSATPPNADTLTPIAPKTTKTSFTGPVDARDTLFGSVMSRYSMMVADGTGNGAPDVIGLRSHPDGAVIDIATGRLKYGECSIWRWFIPDTTIAASDHVLFADIDGDSGGDLITLNASGLSMAATTATRGGIFEDLQTYPTGLAASSVAFAAADFDNDRLADLWEATDDGRLRIWKGPSFTQLLDDSVIPGGTPQFIAAGDRDGGDLPELFALYGDGRVEVATFSGGWAAETSFATGMNGADVAGVSAGDYDGDGRADFEVLDDTGQLSVFRGNSPTGMAPAGWFMNPDWKCGDRVAAVPREKVPVVLDYNGTFFDDEGSIFEANIESIARANVTRGCNPPFQDRFCPRDVVTRETMAAFLVRSLGLTNDTHPGFTDVDPDSTFAHDIGKLATAGITRGCNPPENDRFCPTDPVTRETMAAFLVRALKLTAADHPDFSDVPSGSLFAADITRLATAGITKGCNPPTNDKFCPKDTVSRDTMAAFLDRAGLGD